MSRIEWTEQTWNPIAGCSVVSPGCTNCYAMRIAGDRLKRHPKYAGLTMPSKAGPVWTGETRFDVDALTIPLQRKKPTRYFVNSMSDLFHESVSDVDIDRTFAVMALAQQHQFQVLTKRAARMRAYMTTPDRKRRIAGRAMDVSDLLAHQAGSCDARISLDHFSAAFKPQGVFPNVWLGVSVEDQVRASERIPELLRTPAAVRFLSCEPLLGPLDLHELDIDGRFLIWPLEGTSECENEDGEPTADLPAIDWVIVGGESGPDRRDMDPAWARSIRDECAAAGVPFFMKQMTGKKHIPEDLMIRQWPKAASCIERDVAQEPPRLL